jgi:hypothetical protein
MRIYAKLTAVFFKSGIKFMKRFMPLFFMLALAGLTACGEKTEPQPTAPQAQALQKAEDVQQQSVDTIAEQQKQIEAQSQ